MWLPQGNFLVAGIAHSISPPMISPFAICSPGLRLNLQDSTKHDGPGLESLDAVVNIGEMLRPFRDDVGDRH